MIPWQQIKDQTDIVNLIGEYLQISPKSSNFVALCPFHDDKNPSLTISPDKKIWHCFGCGAGGDCFGFLAQIENISKIEAAKILAAKLHIKIQPTFVKNQNSNFISNSNSISASFSKPGFSSKISPNSLKNLQENSQNPEKLTNILDQKTSDNPTNSTKNSLDFNPKNEPKTLSKHQKGLQYLDLAKRFYHQNLLTILENPNHPVSFYCQKRGLTKAIIQEFQIGWSGSNSDILKICQNYNLDLNLATETGILKKVEKKS